MNLAAIVALIVQIGPLGIQLFKELEGNLNLGPDEKANIAAGILKAETADAATISAATAWMKANGFTPTFVPVGGTAPPTP